MKNIFKRASQGASLGGAIGTAISGVIGTGAAIVAGPILAPAMLAGTLIGGTIGAATGTIFYKETSCNATCDWCSEGDNIGTVTLQNNHCVCYSLDMCKGSWG